MTLATWRGVTGRIFRLRVSSLPVTWWLKVFQMIFFFFQKRRLSFLPLTYNVAGRKIAKLTWPSLISKFRDEHFIDTGKDINRWKLQGDRAFGAASIRMMSIQTFSEVRSLDVTSDLVTWPWVTWVWNFHKMCGKDAWIGIYKKRRHSAEPVFYICEKPEGAVQTPPARRGLFNIMFNYWCCFCILELTNYSVKTSRITFYILEQFQCLSTRCCEHINQTCCS